ncbi:AAA family ATPase [Streptomyces kanamyceticus]|uniref:AAA family ATPase n=1 Tax=Streptomyces kanamyceticus TaxID=1967 RepID=UPI0006E17813|nr:AAA family ATPase [Streptomyces kanamyceticus]
MSKLHVITGAPGAGKTTLLRHLRAYPFGTVDFDELPEADGHLLGIDITSPSASSVWPDYNRLWVKIAAMMLRAGRPVLVLCPLSPDEWASAAAGVADPPLAAWARLDCADEDRRARLAARGWETDEVQDAIEDAEELRGMVDREFTTTGRGPAEVAAAVAEWISCGAERHSAA